METTNEGELLPEIIINVLPGGITHEALEKLKQECLDVEITGDEDTDYDVCKTQRTKVRKLKSQIEKRRKTLKEEPLELGRKIDKAAKEVTAAIEEGEAHLNAHMTSIENARRERIETHERELKERFDARVRAMTRYSFTLSPGELREMNDEDFETVVQKAKADFEEAEAKRKAEQEELEKFRASRDAQVEKLEKERAQAEHAKNKLIEKQQEEIEQKNVKIANFGNVVPLRSGYIDSVLGEKVYVGVRQDFTNTVVQAFSTAEAAIDSAKKAAIELGSGAEGVENTNVSADGQIFQIHFDRGESSITVYECLVSE